MEKHQIEDLRGRVTCAAVLEEAGFALDPRESTRRALKYRRAAVIVIVIHEGRGWFDPLSDAKGDVFALVAHLHGESFPEALDRVAGLVGARVSAPVWRRSREDASTDVSIAERWRARPVPRLGSATGRYLRDERGLSEFVLRAAIRQDLLREGPKGSMWAAYTDDDGALVGWEERGSRWRGFSTGGEKVLFRFGSADAVRTCVTEAAIDAMSLADLEGVRPDSLYVATGGGWSPATEAALRRLASRPETLLVAATDADAQGEIYAERIVKMAVETGCRRLRLSPVRRDWNLMLQMKEGRGERWEEWAEGALPPDRRPPRG
jgi:hypothetical protein